MQSWQRVTKELDNKIQSKPTTTAVNVQDSLALVALYNSTDGDNWNNNTNWLSGPVDSWNGIIVHDSWVSYIDLGNNNLNGTIPPEL